jgi:hypothetical protein
VHGRCRLRAHDCYLCDLSYLRNLRRWLSSSLETAPEFYGDYFHRYWHDVDALLDVRGRLMGL